MTILTIIFSLILDSKYILTNGIAYIYLFAMMMDTVLLITYFDK